MVRARSGSWGTALLTGESRLGAGAGELAQRELDHGQQRLWRIGAKPAPYGDPCRRGDRSGENLRPHIGSGIGAGPLGDRRGERLLHLGVDLQVLAADRGRAHNQLDRAHQLRVKRTAIAARLGAEFAEFPGGHLAPMELPVPFAAGLCDVFGRL